MSDTTIALFRGINVGGRNVLPMAELRALGVPVTARNWRTVGKLVEMVKQP